MRVQFASLTPSARSRGSRRAFPKRAVRVRFPTSRRLVSSSSGKDAALSRQKRRFNSGWDRKLGRRRWLPRGFQNHGREGSIPSWPATRGVRPIGRTRDRQSRNTRSIRVRSTGPSSNGKILRSQRRDRGSSPRGSTWARASGMRHCLASSARRFDSGRVHHLDARRDSCRCSTRASTLASRPCRSCHGGNCCLVSSRRGFEHLGRLRRTGWCAAARTHHLVRAATRSIMAMRSPCSGEVRFDSDEWLLFQCTRVPSDGQTSDFHSDDGCSIHLARSRGSATLPCKQTSGPAFFVSTSRGVVPAGE